MGFYNNDDSSLSNETTEEVKPKITKKKKEEVKKITKDSTNNIVEQIKDLKILLDDGIITKEEFEKAKKKLLN